MTGLALMVSCWMGIIRSASRLNPPGFHLKMGTPLLSYPVSRQEFMKHDEPIHPGLAIRLKSSSPAGTPFQDAQIYFYTKEIGTETRVVASLWQKGLAWTAWLNVVQPASVNLYTG